MARRLLHLCHLQAANRLAEFHHQRKRRLLQPLPRQEVRQAVRQLQKGGLSVCKTAEKTCMNLWTLANHCHMVKNIWSSSRKQASLQKNKTKSKRKLLQVYNLIDGLKKSELEHELCSKHLKVLAERVENNTIKLVCRLKYISVKLVNY